MRLQEGPKGLLERAAAACMDADLGRAVLKACDHAVHARESALSRMGDYQAAREAVIETRSHSLDNLDALLDQFSTRLEEQGVQLFVAENSEEARAYVHRLAREHGIRMVVKSKSMTGEEAGLTQAVEEAGCRVVETDLGEHIVQLRGEAPSHIIAPALHVSRGQVGDLFADKLGMEHTDDPAALCAFARRVLRPDFLSADMGLVGINTLVAGTGDMITVTNEGNGRLCETLPRVLVAFTGIEKVVADLDDAASILRVLSKNATGQTATTYVSLLRGPGGENDAFGPREIHLVLMDNGRSSIMADPDIRDILRCIRCGACLNACPVYRSIGGHAYGATYVGPMGIVLTNGIEGEPTAGEMTYACTLCGECGRVCPAGIDLPGMILKLRSRTRKPVARRAAMKAAQFAFSGPRRFSLAGRVAGALDSAMPRVFDSIVSRTGWKGPVRAPSPSKASFRKLWRDWNPAGPLVATTPVQASGDRRPGSGDRGACIKPDASSSTSPGPLDEFEANFRETGGELVRGSWDDALRSILEDLDAPAVFMDVTAVKAGMDKAVPDGRRVLVDPDCRGLSGIEAGEVPVGVTGCLALVAETGSILLRHGNGSERVASLLPDVHVVIARPEQLLKTCEQALAMRDEDGSPSATFITGPSRTADIEKILILGMHGPRRLVLLLEG